MCGSSLCLERRRCRGTEGVWVLQGNSYEAGTPKGENGRYQAEVQAALGLSSRLHVLAGIGLRRAVEARA